MTPKVSVIVPIYNVEQYLKQCLDSVCAQTLKDIEIICINDGSTDGSLKILESYAKKDKRIKIIDKQNEGYGKTMNLGIQIAKAKYIGIVESDDFIESNMYEKLYTHAKRHDADIVKSNFYVYIDLVDHPPQIMPHKIRDHIPQDYLLSHSHSAILLSIHPSIWTCIYKRDFLIQRQIYFLDTPGSGWSDNPFQVMSICLAKKIVWIDRALYYWRVREKTDAEMLKDYKIPFERTDEIFAFLRKHEIHSSDILLNIYKRTLNYIGIVYDMKSISDHKDCFMRVKKCVDNMDQQLILNSDWNSKSKRFYKICRYSPKLAFYMHHIWNLRRNILRLKIRKDMIHIQIGKFVLYKSKGVA